MKLLCGWRFQSSKYITIYAVSRKHFFRFFLKSWGTLKIRFPILLVVVRLWPNNCVSEQSKGLLKIRNACLQLLYNLTDIKKSWFWVSVYLYYILARCFAWCEIFIFFISWKIERFHFIQICTFFILWKIYIFIRWVSPYVRTVWAPSPG